MGKSSHAPSHGWTVTILLLVLGDIGFDPVHGQMTYENCVIYENNKCNVLCATQPYNCYYVNMYHLCPCQLQCYQQYCMAGKMIETCPHCAAASIMCRPWHDHIELHSCGDKTFTTREAFRNHCKAWAQCVAACPTSGECYDPNAKPNYANWDWAADAARVNEVLGVRKRSNDHSMPHNNVTTS